MKANKEQPVCEDLDAAADKYESEQQEKYKDRDNHDFDNYRDGFVDGLTLTYDAFKAGAQWQFEHQWVSVKDRLPIEEFDDGYTFVFVNISVDEDTYRLETDYIRNGKWELHPNENITHWMPIPPIPNKED